MKVAFLSISLSLACHHCLLLMTIDPIRKTIDGKVLNEEKV